MFKEININHKRHIRIKRFCISYVFPYVSYMVKETNYYHIRQIRIKRISISYVFPYVPYMVNGLFFLSLTYKS